MINHEGAYNKMRLAVERGNPFMFARYGDGEGIVLGYPNETPRDRYVKRLDKWFGTKGMTDKDLKRFADQVRESVKHCDLVGVPETRHTHLNSDWRSVLRIIHANKLLHSGQEVCGMDVVLWVQRQRWIPKLIAGVDRLCCITCRDVRKELMRVCHGLKEIEFFYLPPQMKPMVGPDMANGMRHWPTLFNAVPRWLDQHCSPGQVFFIGAGGAGKIYAQMVKERGGVALDVGSLFDGWAGKLTRTHIKNEVDTWRL